MDDAMKRSSQLEAIHVIIGDVPMLVRHLEAAGNNAPLGSRPPFMVRDRAH
jgi:hypothetical protein